MPPAMRLLVPLLLLFALPLTPGASMAASACHPDIEQPAPVIVALPGGYEVSATATATNGGCSHQPRTSACLSVTRGNETIAVTCLNLP